MLEPEVEVVVLGGGAFEDAEDIDEGCKYMVKRVQTI